MPAPPSRPDSIQETVRDVRAKCPEGSTISFLSGDFNIIHPGHIRLLEFAAECGDCVVVGVNGDGFGHTLVKESLRLKNVQSCAAVDHAFLLKCPPEQLIAGLKPHYVIKGNEHADDDNPERAVVERYGGELLFCSGNIRLASVDLADPELLAATRSCIVKAWDFPDRHQFTIHGLEKIVNKFSTLNVIVVGDIIVDEYVNCQPLGMSQEDPTIVVSPIACEKYLGGAGIVAAHTRQLGAKTSLFSVTGHDDAADFARSRLEEYGVSFHIEADATRPTTHKKRFRTANKTLLRVSELRQHEISVNIRTSLLEKLGKVLPGTDVLIFSDFNYGVLPQSLVDAVIDLCKTQGVFVAADSQSSSQNSDISRFAGADFVTPTEREARMACGDFSSGLAVVMQSLQAAMNDPCVILTLAEEGLLIQGNKYADDRLMTDRLPAFNMMPVDVAGAGDSLLASASLCLALGGSVWQASFLGSVAAACQVGRVGNAPLKADALIAGLQA